MTESLMSFLDFLELLGPRPIVDFLFSFGLLEVSLVSLVLLVKLMLLVMLLVLVLLVALSLLVMLNL